MRWFLHDLLNKQVLRTFSFIPAIGWREVDPKEVQHLFRDDLQKLKKHDRASYRHTCDGKLVSFVIAFYANENKKDINRVKSVLKNALQRHEEAMKKKSA